MEVLHLLLLQRIEQAESFQFHWHYMEMKLFNLYFADDLLLFCRAEEQSVTLFHDALHKFADLPGLHPNVNKNQLISSNICETPITCGPWISRGVQLLKSVISTLNVYWAMAYILPKGVLKAIEARMRTFLWRGGRDAGVVKVAWVDVCKPLEEGGQAQEGGGSWSWRKILKLRNQLLGGVSYHVGMGDDIWLWQDPWHPLGALIYRFPSGPRVVGIPLEAKVSMVIDEGGWNRPLITDIEHMEIVEQLPSLVNSDTIDWNSVGRVFLSLRHTVCSNLRDRQYIGMVCFVVLFAPHVMASSCGLQSWKGYPH
ncbi:UNVERIFIED_CONTAM: hypothetical protein Slati_0886200 [Sesamum latifolium]|uniref:Reverse transcriptase domain-containing protein n=1 Tax=Sesamum latifolium TaxID=2727402 RepID=A0AAW2XN46_9LAMI